MIKEIKPTIYPVTIFLCIGGEMKDFGLSLSRRLKCPIRAFEEQGNAEARTIINGAYSAIWIKGIPKDCDFAKVASHEAFHAAYGALEYVGIELTPQSEEAFAYMVGHIVKELWNLREKTLSL